MNSFHRVAMNTGILYARMVFTVFLSFYTTRILLDALGIVDFGIFNVVGGAIAMLTFLNASMAASTHRFMAYAQGQGDERRQRNVFNVSVVIHAATALVVVSLLEGVGLFLFSGILKIETDRLNAAWLVYQALVASTIFVTLSVPYDAIINARENMLLFAILKMIEVALKLGIAFFIAATGSDRLVLYGLLMATLSFVLLALRALYCHTHYNECQLAPHRNFSFQLFKEINSFAGWSLIGTSTSMVANYGQIVVLNMFFGTAINAAQGVANQVSGQLSVLANSMMQALTPLIAKSEGAGNRELMLKASMIGSKMSFFLLTVLYVPVIVEMPYLFGLWLKNVPQYTVIFCSLILLRMLVEQLFVTLVSSIGAVGNIKNYQLFTSFLTLLPLPISFLFFKAGFAPYTLYVIFLFYSVIVFATTLYFACRICNFSALAYLYEIIFRCILSFFLILSITAIPTLILDSGLLRMLLVIIISFFSFISIVWLIGLCSRERTAAKKMISNILKNLFNKFIQD